MQDKCSIQHLIGPRIDGNAVRLHASRFSRLTSLSGSWKLIKR